MATWFALSPQLAVGGPLPVIVMLERRKDKFDERVAEIKEVTPWHLLSPFGVPSIITVLPAPWPMSVIPVETVKPVVHVTPPGHSGIITVSPFAVNATDVATSDLLQDAAV